jgi:hypothetical protein
MSQLVQTSGVVRYSEEHSLFSASAASRWTVCPASLAADGGEEDTSLYAAEGSLMHEAASEILLGLTPPKVGEVINTDGYDIEYTAEMEENVLSYVDYIQGRPWVGGFKTESRVFYGKSLGVAVNLAFGTCDASGFTHDEAGSSLEIIDAKFGRNIVPAKNNSQLTLYAAGFIEDYRTQGVPLSPALRVRLSIYQPRVSRRAYVWETTVADIERAVMSMRPAVQAGMRYYQGAATTEDGVDFPELIGNHCTYCRRKVKCKSFQSALTSCARAEIVEWNPLVFQAKDAIVKYLEELEAWAYDSAMQGTPLTGTKLVKGRAGRATLNVSNDEIRAEAKALGVENAVVAVEEVWKTPAKIRDALKTAGISPERLKEIINTPEGKPQLALADDPRPEYTRVDTSDFTGEEVSL